MLNTGSRRRLAKAFVSEAFQHVLNAAPFVGLSAEDRESYLSDALGNLRREITSRPERERTEGIEATQAA